MSLLYDIPAAIRDLTDPETGEILDIKAFEALQGQWQDKVEWLALGIKNDLAMAAAVKAEKAALDEREKRHKARAERGKRYLALVLDGKPFETGKVRVTTRKNAPAVVVYGDREELVKYLQQHHPECVKTADPEISKTALKEILKTEEVPGVKLESWTSLTIK